MSGLIDLATTAEGCLGLAVSVANRVSETDASLRVCFAGAADDLKPILIPAPWTFASCLLATNSDSVDADSDIDAQLIGLNGARLTAIESGERSVDLVFDSIRISAFAADSIQQG